MINCFRAFTVWVKFIKLMEVLFQNMQMSGMEEARNKCIRESRIFAAVKALNAGATCFWLLFLLFISWKSANKER